ncbi:MAG: SRPBCC family protein [Myxococcales bacterium]|nr:SRPBCC family protein [Myxococcales bacterium]
MGRFGHYLVLLSPLVLGVLFFTAPAEAQGSFTAAERQQLKDGKLVSRAESRQRGELKLIGGTSWQVIDLPPTVVWKAVTDFPNYPSFLPRAKQTRVMEKKGKKSVVWVLHQEGPVRAEYSLDMIVEPRARMGQFRLNRTRKHDIREGWGFFSVQPYGSGKSIVSFGILADVGSGVLSGLVRPTVQKWILRVPSELRKYLRGRGKSRYLP